MNKGLKIFLVILIIVAIIGGCVFAFIYFTKDNETQKGNDESKNNEVVLDTTQIFTADNYPVVDGSTATIPLSEAFKRNFTGDNTATVNHATTHYSYLNLIDGKSDLLLATYPSAEEEQAAEQKGIKLEITPVVNEGFVFYVNENNPVKSLTLEQIRQIYAGEITNWKEVGGDDAKIVAYQREPNSGSQTGMEKLVMNGRKLMEPPKEDIIMDMASIVNLVSNYDNGKYAIGYSYYYYATTMYDDIDSAVTDRIRFLGIDGVVPNEQTIKDGTYPIRTAYYIIINAAEEQDSPVRKLAEAMLSDRGQAAAKGAKYVPVR